MVSLTAENNLLRAYLVLDSRVVPGVKDLSSCHSVETPNLGCPPGPIAGRQLPQKSKNQAGLLPKDLPGKCRIADILTQKLELLQLFVVSATS